MKEDYQALRVSEIYYLTLEDKKEGRKERGGERGERDKERERPKGICMYIYMHIKHLNHFLYTIAKQKGYEH